MLPHPQPNIAVYEFLLESPNRYRFIRRTQLTHIYVCCDCPINSLLMSWALRALQKPGQLQHILNRVRITRSAFSTHFIIHTAAEMTFFSFFLQSWVKSPKHVSLEHGLTEEANRLIPLGHKLIRSKAWGQIRPCSRSGDEYSSSECSVKRMTKIKPGHKAPNAQLWRQRGQLSNSGRLSRPT